MTVVVLVNVEQPGGQLGDHLGGGADRLQLLKSLGVWNGGLRGREVEGVRMLLAADCAVGASVFVIVEVTAIASLQGHPIDKITQQGSIP